MWLFCVTAALPKDLGHDRQIPSPHFSDLIRSEKSLTLNLIFITTYCVIIFCRLRVRDDAELTMMMRRRSSPYHLKSRRAVFRHLHCDNDASPLNSGQHNTEAESSWSQLFAAMNANLGQQSLLGNLIIPDTARGKVLCCACNHPTALSWVMRSSTNYWTVSRLELTKLACVLNPLLKP